MPNPKPRKPWKSDTLVRLHVPKTVYNPRTPADLLHYDNPAIEGWTAVLLAIDPANLTPKGRDRILKDFGRLLTVLIQEQNVLGTRKEHHAAVVRKWHELKDRGKRPTASAIARSLGMNLDEVRRIVTKLRSAYRAN